MIKSSFIAILVTWIFIELTQGAFVYTPTNTLGTDCDKYDRQGWLTLFNGDSTYSENFLWISKQTGHGNTGGSWWVARDTALERTKKIQSGQNILWSNQNAGGNGGVFMSKKKYSNYEVMVSVFPGWNNDGGLFHRTTPGGQAYQMMIDYRGGGTVGGFWPEGTSGTSQDVYNLSSETAVRKGGSGGAFMNWPLTDWPLIWDADGFNTVICRMTGPTTGAGNTKLECWMKDTLHVTTYKTDLASRASGHIGLQIHAGAGSWQGGPNKYKWIKVRELDSITGKTPVCAANPEIAAYDVDYTNPAKGVLRCNDLPRGCPEGIKPFSNTPNTNVRIQWEVNSGADLRVSAKIEGGYSISLMDLSGKILSTKSGTGSFSHNFEGLVGGAYVVRLKTSTGVYSQKVVRF